MKLFALFSYTAITALTLTACSNADKQAAATFEQVAAIVEQNPDSALLLLSIIEQPEDLPHKQRMEYELLNVQAKDKAYQDITADTFILEVARYYAQKKKPNKAALALFYAGRVRQEQSRYEEATRCYLRTIDNAKSLNNKILHGMACYNLGGLNRKLLHTDKAIACYKQAYQCFCSKPDDYRRQAMAISAIGASYSVNNQQDSALHYLERGLKLAVLLDDSTLQSSIYQLIGVAFQVQGTADKAHASFLQAIHLGVDSHDEAVLYRNLADSYLSLGRRDSALLYMQLLLQPNMQDTTAMGQAITYELLSTIEEVQGSYEKALEYHKQYADYQAKEYESMLGDSVHEVEKKYLLEKMQAEQRIKNLTTWLTTLALLVGVSLICFFFYWHSVQRKEKLQEAQAAIRTLQELVKGYSATEKTLKNELAEQLNILNSVHLMELQLSDNERKQGRQLLNKVHQIVLGQKELSWERFYRVVNLLYNNFADKLQQKYPRLSENELRICCLSLGGLDNDQQAFILKLSKGYIQNKKTAIRKLLQLKEYGDLKEALDRLMA